MGRETKNCSLDLVVNGGKQIVGKKFRASTSGKGGVEIFLKSERHSDTAISGGS